MADRDRTRLKLDFPLPAADPDRSTKPRADATKATACNCRNCRGTWTDALPVSSQNSHLAGVRPDTGSQACRLTTIYVEILQSQSFSVTVRHLASAARWCKKVSDDLFYVKVTDVEVYRVSPRPSRARGWRFGVG